jgi:hypothetical protein
VQTRPFTIPRSQYRSVASYGPRNAKIGIVTGEPTLGFWIITRAHLVNDLTIRFERAVAMGESGWYIKLFQFSALRMVVRCRPKLGEPRRKSTTTSKTLPRTSDQFCLRRLPDLEM